MRVGGNPMRSKQVDGLPQVIVSAITHLPDFDGYHEHRFEVVKRSLETMRGDCATYIWDNGSCKEFRDWLINEYKPDFLTLSPNIGKASARAAIIHSLPENRIIGIADDDMLYYPGWLKESIKILETYPDVGVVSGYPVRTQFRWGNDNTIAWAKKHAKVTKGRYITEEWDFDFCVSIGRDYDRHVRDSLLDLETMIEYKGVKALATGHHCQFIGYAGRLKPHAVWDSYAMGNERPFDESIDKAGLLRLTTPQRYTQHIGNVLDNKYKEAA